VPDAIEKILTTYVKLRQPGEEFLYTYRRLGPQPFKEALYAAA
jgi:sulfite reductase (NADPH) hemoprotein beta-component